MNAWFAQHRAALASAFRRLWATPLNTLLSLLVIGIALTLPGLGYVLLDNLRDLGRTTSGVQQISLFMQLDASKKDVGDIENRLKQAATGKWRFVPKEAALKRMQTNEGMAEIVASLPRNPLPDAFIVEPTNVEPEALEILRKEIAGWPKVAHVQLDSAWVKRFDAFLKLGRLALWMLAGIFAAGLVAATFNTIRLQVMAQAAEGALQGAEIIERAANENVRGADHSRHLDFGSLRHDLQAYGVEGCGNQSGRKNPGQHPERQPAELEESVEAFDPG